MMTGHPEERLNGSAGAVPAQQKKRRVCEKAACHRKSSVKNVSNKCSIVSQGSVKETSPSQEAVLFHVDQAAGKWNNIISIS